MPREGNKRKTDSWMVQEAVTSRNETKACFLKSVAVAYTILRNIHPAIFCSYLVLRTTSFLQIR